VLVLALNFGVAQKNIGVRVRTLNFGVTLKNIGVQMRALNFGVAWKNIGVQVRALNFGVAWKNVGVQVCMLNLALCSVHIHNKVCVVYTHIIMAHVVCILFVQLKGVWLVRVQCWDMLSCYSLVNGARNAGAWWERTKIWHDAARRVNFMQNINVR
jgi:hypothetical protein